MEYSEGEQMVKVYLHDPDMPMKIGSVVEKKLAWFFFCNSVEYLDNGDFSAALVGQGPIEVSKADGSMSFHGSLGWQERFDSME